MAFRTKISLFNDKVCQGVSDSLILSGVTSFATTANVCFDVHPTFTGDTQVVDKKYVDDLISTGGTGGTNLGAANGLSIVSNNVELGGIVTKNTNIELPLVGTGTTTCLNIGDPARTEANIYIENGDVGTISLTKGLNQVLIDSSGITIQAATCGAVYAADYSSVYVDRSLVDKAYVDGQISGITGTGTVTSVAALTIATTGTDITSSVVNSTTTPVITLCIPTASATNRGALSSSDWSTFNSKTTCVGTVTGANNGLSATSTTVSLGGTLINNTCIGGSYTLGFHNSAINLTGDTSVNIGGTVTLKTVPATGTGDVLTYNASTGAIEKTTLSTLGGITGGTNGIGVTGQDVCLGGTLAAATTISGIQSLTLGNLNGINLRTTNSCNIEINSQSNGGIIIKSQSGTTLGNDFTNAVGILADFNGGFIVYDNREIFTGIQYDDDYSTGYVDRSLVDKAYVDSIATGLDAHAAVVAATTPADGNIQLTGLTTTIDGLTPSNGDRILVKDQTDGTENGIYSASTGVWGRTTDYDYNPSGEIANGDLIPVTSGSTQAASVWILVTPNPIVSGTTELIFSLFSKQLSIIDGDGIDIATVGSNQQISVLLSSSTPGLCFDGGKLELDYLNVVGSGLTENNGCISVNASQTPASGTEIPVIIGTGCALFVDSADFSYTSAANGLTKVGCNVQLGGALNTGTTISIGGTTSLKFTDTRSTTCGIEYTGDYRTGFQPNTLVTKCYVDVAVSIATGETAALTGSNGITRVGDEFLLGGSFGSSNTIICNPNDIFFNIGDWGDDSYFSVGGGNVDLSTNNGNTFMIFNPEDIGIRTCNMSIYLGGSGEEIWLRNFTNDVCAVFSGYSMQYDKDYETCFVPRSLVTKQYVDGETAALTGSNGITRVGDNLTLGGALTNTTTISGAQILNFNINNFNITGATTIGGAVTLTSVAAGSVSTDEVVVITSGGEVKKIAASTLGEDNNIYSKTVVTNTTTLTTSSSYLILVNHTAPVTITLPASPTDGQTFKIKDASSTGALTNNITIARNGNNIDRAASDAIINTDGGAFEMTYDETLGWFVLAFVN